jgi:hypothetical protein
VQLGGEALAEVAKLLFTPLTSLSKYDLSQPIDRYTVHISLAHISSMSATANNTTAATSGTDSAGGEWFVRTGKKHQRVKPVLCTDKQTFWQFIKDGRRPFIDFGVSSDILCPKMYSGWICDCKDYVHIRRCDKLHCRVGKNKVCTYLHVWNMPDIESRELYVRQVKWPGANAY